MLMRLLFLLPQASQRQQEQQQRISELLKAQEIIHFEALTQGQDAERSRLARELHDRVGSLLATVKYRYSAMEEGFEGAHNSYEELDALIDTTCEEVRQVASNLSAGPLSTFGHT